MGEIYRCSKRVLAWLGTPDRDEREDPNLDTTLRTVADLPESTRRFDELLISYEPLTDPDLFSQMLQADYWGRLWVIQEMCLAPRLELLYGTGSMLWEDCQHATVLATGRHDFRSDRRIQHLKRLHTVMRPVVGETFPETNLLALLKLSEKAECEDRRDKVYGILGLASDIIEGDIAIDYTLSLFEVYWNVMTEFASPVSEVPLRRPLVGPPIIELSQVLQKSLLRPDLRQTGYLEMANGRRAWRAKLLSSKVPLRPGQWEALTGNPRGTITEMLDVIYCGKSTAFEVLDAEQSVEQNMVKNLLFNTTVTDMIWNLDHESFCLFQYGAEQDDIVRPAIGESLSGLAVFTTDTMETGLAPRGIRKGDILWEYAYEGCLPLHAIVRNPQSSGPRYQVCGRAYLNHSNHTVPVSDLDLKPISLKGGNKIAKVKIKHSMEILVHLPVLQVLTSPLRSKLPRRLCRHGVGMPSGAESSSEVDQAHTEMETILSRLVKKMLQQWSAGYGDVHDRGV